MRNRFCQGFSVIEISVLVAVIGFICYFFFPKYITLDMRSKDERLVQTLTMMRSVTMDYFAHQIEAGNPVGFPELSGELFVDGQVPEDPYFKSNDVKVVSHFPFVQEDFDNDGGWLYFRESGEIVVDYYSKRDF